MKKILFALLLLGATVGTASAQVEIGLKVSPSITNLRVDSPSSYDFRNEKVKLGFGGGIIIDYFFGQNYAFSTGLFLTGKGGTLSYYDPSTSKRQEQKIGVQYLEAPVTIKLFTNDIATDVKLYFQVGGMLGGALTSRIDGEKFYRDPGNNNAETKASKHVIIPDVGLLGAAGVEYQLGQSTRLLVGLSYHRGIVNIDHYFDKTRNFKDVTIKNNEVALDLGIKF